MGLSRGRETTERTLALEMFAQHRARRGRRKPNRWLDPRQLERTATLNGDLKPTDLKPGSNKRVWWLCPTCGYEWDVAPKDRRRGEQCPECAERQRNITKSTPKPGRSLADLYPGIAAEWHPTKNAPLTAADVNPGSKKKRWWRCQTCSHDWETDPDHRTRRGGGCPRCRYKNLSRTKATPKPEESLAERNQCGAVSGDLHYASPRPN
jgi:rubrerythrin